MSIRSALRNFSEAFFEPREFELEGKLYKKLGMHAASRMLGYVNYLGEGSRFKVRKWDGPMRENIERLYSATCGLEAGHWGMAALGVAAIPTAPLVGVGFALGNAYISLLHRYNRARATNILGKARKTIKSDKND